MNFEEMFQSAAKPAEPFLRLIPALLLAVAAGFWIARVHARSTRRNGSTSSSMTTTLVLLTILVAITTLVISDSVARAFSLVGALSIVRFRTFVEDTKDTAFVVFAVVMGMAFGTHSYAVGFAGLLVVSTAAFWMSRRGVGVGDVSCRISLRCALSLDISNGLTPCLAARAADVRLVRVSSVRQGAAQDLVYQVRLSDPAHLLQILRDIQLLDGIQTADAEIIGGGDV